MERLIKANMGYKDSKIIFSFRYNKYFKKVIRIERRLILERSLDIPFPNLAYPENIEIRFTTMEDIFKLGTKHGYDAKGFRYAKMRMAAGDKCMMAFRDDDILGYEWIMHDRFELSNDDLLKLSNEFFYTYKGFVVKEYRRKGILSLIDRNIHDYFVLESALEKKYWVTWILENNRASLRNRLKASFQVIGSLWVIQCLGFRTYYLSNKLRSYLEHKQKF